MQCEQSGNLETCEVKLHLTLKKQMLKVKQISNKKWRKEHNKKGIQKTRRNKRPQDKRCPQLPETCCYFLCCSFKLYYCIKIMLKCSSQYVVCKQLGPVMSYRMITCSNASVIQSSRCFYCHRHNENTAVHSVMKIKLCCLPTQQQ